MGFKHQKQIPPNPPRQDSPIPCMPFKHTKQQPTPGLSGTQWSEDSFCCKPQAIPFLVLTFEVIEPTMHPFLEPSQHNEPPICTPTPPITGLSEVPASQVPPTVNDSTCEPEPEVAPMQ
ncbi:hypothetical protein O181_003466 [Austropuccinia psidii MF-1]|uniref:Uncharacterized protein n=1 Tax=Austropuccinia psidii MF-1 TaxID=1389203 RepID=A0A9Q3GE67_9BASI|nr:hypothetical protein [Austropuccinia psidii MF-1]